MGALVLAAGSGRRFGGAKLLAPFRGKPLLTHVLEAAGRAESAGLVATSRVVVAGSDDTAAALAESTGHPPVRNPEPERGLSSSLRLGLDALPGGIDAVLVLLGDQPLVRLEVLEALVTAWRAGAGVLIRPRYADASAEPGHPVLADRSVWPLAERLQGEAGFGAALPVGAPGVTLIDVTGGNPDVDTPADLHSLEGSAP
ncbi:MAG TPA: nucleotidyltransferase family protein [Gemmatimonadales bacterium]